LKPSVPLALPEKKKKKFFFEKIEKIEKIEKLKKKKTRNNMKIAVISLPGSLLQTPIRRGGSCFIL